MNPFGPENINTQTRRLPQRQVRRGSGGLPGMSVGGGFVFGGIFVAVGTWITLAGLKIIAIDARKLHVPFPVFALIGIVFLLPGLWMWFTTFRAWLGERHRRQRVARGEQEPAMLDYPWDSRRWTADRWAGAKRAGFGALFMTIFMSATGYIVFFERDIPVFVKVVFSIFILATVWMWIQLIRELWRGVKYGATAVGYDAFPLRLGQTARLRWMPPRRLLAIDAGTATLRCVHEWTQVVRTGNKRTTQIHHEALWESVREVEVGTLIRPTDDIELTFALPADRPETCLGEREQTIYWELEMKLSVPGLDFQETYLVPVYEA